MKNVPSSLKRLFFKTATANIATAGCNFLATVFVVRWFGTGTYAHYQVDLAYLSLLMIILELVPSSYSIFSVQDDSERIKEVAALLTVTAIVLALISAIYGHVLGLFQASSNWIPIYAALMAIKRYIDIRLQSTGRLSAYFGIEFRGAVIRIGLMALAFFCKVSPTEAVWGSLAGATLLTQTIWFARHPDERHMFRYLFHSRTWHQLFADRRAYVPYYFGIALKRMRDNIVPIMGNSFFISEDALGMFLLAYRGLSFTLGQIRVIEALLNHRHTLSTASKFSFVGQSMVAATGQIICIIASLGLMMLSNVHNENIYTILLLSCIVWIYVIKILKQAYAYSVYDTLTINTSLFTYCCSAYILMLVIKFFGVVSETSFSMILITAEACSLGAIVSTQFLKGRVYEPDKSHL